MIASAAAEGSAVTTALQDGVGTDEKLRLARAEIARLKLELRAVTHRADALEQLHGGTEPLDVAADGPDVTAACELLALSLGQHLDARRAALSAELSEARTAATRLVESAHQRAQEYVAGAHDLVLAVALHPDESLAPLPALPLEVVPDIPQCSAPVAGPVAVARAMAPPRPRPPLRSRLLHVDVILPLLAVVAVLLILIAWVG
jgi:hypothetical protein